MNSVKVLICAALIVAYTAASSDAGWLIYHEPEFKGTILDTDTKQPIEGAVVVAVYQKATMGLGAGSIDSIINVREVKTDKDGKFRIPSYTTFIQPFSWQIPSRFIFIKPGYASLKLGKSYFTGEEKREQEWQWHWSNELKFRLRASGIIELPAVRTREERQQARMDADISGAQIKEEELPLLYKLIDGERRSGI